MPDSFCNADQIDEIVGRIDEKRREGRGGWSENEEDMRIII